MASLTSPNLKFNDATGRLYCYFSHEMKLSMRFFSYLPAVLVAATTSGATLPMKEPRQTEEQAREQIASFAKSWHNRSEWEARARNIRESILREANLAPLPARCELKPIVWGKRDCKGYTVQNVAFESL